MRLELDLNYLKDLHITIGFKYKDVFGVRKNQVMEKVINF
jgi:hypothetical protein